MPRRDGTGPMGNGSMTGRGMGFCNLDLTEACGLGFRRRIGRGFGLNKVINSMSSENKEELLIKQKDMLEERINLIEKQLQDLQNGK